MLSISDVEPCCSRQARTRKPAASDQCCLWDRLAAWPSAWLTECLTHWRSYWLTRNVMLKTSKKLTKLFFCPQQNLSWFVEAILNLSISLEELACTSPYREECDSNILGFFLSKKLFLHFDSILSNHLHIPMLLGMWRWNFKKMTKLIFWVFAPTKKDSLEPFWIPVKPWIISDFKFYLFVAPTNTLKTNTGSHPEFW